MKFRKVFTKKNTEADSDFLVYSPSYVNSIRMAISMWCLQGVPVDKAHIQGCTCFCRARGTNVHDAQDRLMHRHMSGALALL